ncbi:MAG: Zn-dependent hydrolase [Vicinamibacterales bacterium]
MNVIYIGATIAAVLISRRSLLAGLATTSATVLTSRSGHAARISQSAVLLRVEAEILRERLEALSVFGRPAGGTFADGVSRVAYSDADVAGRQYVIGLMKSAGLSPRIDPAGNIFGRRAGTETSLPPILFGSHIDSVPSGGNFDGDLGSLGALSVMEALDRAAIRTRHPLEMVVWAAEEGVAFGRGLACSRIVAGDIKPADMDQVWNGMRRADAIRKVGGDPDRILEARRQRGAYHRYVELHIEQGGALERAEVPIGVVEGIVAIDRYDAVITGFANHAGTTPMAERHDALLAASHLTVAVREVVTRMAGRQVGTVGHIEVTPNAPNVVAGRAQLTIEFRDLAEDTLLKLADALRGEIPRIEAATATTISLTNASRNPAAAASPEVQTAVERASADLGLKTMRLPSGAGHDAQMMAQLMPMGVIFVPSIGGISHSPKELTKWEDCANGANVLLRTILELDSRSNL